MIEIQRLVVAYGGRRVVDDVSFRCDPGTITGFLGPNGAGKSTTLRTLCGLAKPSSGTASVCGRSYASLANPARTVGVLLDAGAQHAGRSGREALVLAAMTARVPGARVDEVLEVVDLDQRAARARVGTYSLGMRQRLGLALALLADPDVLVLDEPVNGLDPAGIRWMRELLQGVAAKGGTVLLSSHLLHEVGAVADRLVVMVDGRAVAAGATAELLSTGRTRVVVVDRPRLLTALDRQGLTWATASDGGVVINAPARRVGDLAAADGHVLLQMGPVTSAVEDLYLSLTDAGASAPVTSADEEVHA